MRSRALVLSLLAVTVLASCSSGDDKKKSAAVSSTTSSTAASTAVTGQAFSPEPNSIQGVGGAGILVDLAFRSKEPDLLKATVRTTSPGRPGRNPAFPGLVVTLSTTFDGIGGPNANLADLFQLVSTSQQPDGSTAVWATWTNLRPDFGFDVDSTLTAYVVRGDAPATVTPERTGLDVVSNILTVNFHVSGGGAGGSSTTTPPTTAAGGVTTTRRTTPTTVRATTTTRPATTTTGATTPSTSPPTSSTP